MTRAAHQESAVTASGSPQNSASPRRLSVTCAAFLLVLALVVGVGPSVGSAEPVDASAGRVVGNFASWTVYGRDFHVADIPAAGTSIAARQPVTTVFAEADSLSLLNERLQNRLRQVRRLLAI